MWEAILTIVVIIEFIFILYILNTLKNYREYQHVVDKNIGKRIIELEVPVSWLEKIFESEIEKAKKEGRHSEISDI